MNSAMPQREQVHPFLRGTLLDINQSGKRSYLPDSPCTEDILHRHTLLYCTKGRGELIIDGSSSKMGRKTLLLIAPDLFRLAVSEDNRRIYERELSFPLRGVIEKTGTRTQYLLRRFASEFLIAKGGQPRYPIEELHELLGLLLEENPDEESPAVPVSNAPEQWLPLTVQYMQEHFDHDITLEKLGELAGMHPAYFSHLFKQKMNKTPNEFLTHLRMNKAKETYHASDPWEISRQAFLKMDPDLILCKDNVSVEGTRKPRRYRSDRHHSVDDDGCLWTFANDCRDREQAPVPGRRRDFRRGQYRR